MTIRTISYGGGVQSTALIVLAAQGRIGHVDAALFANVGDDSEMPETLTFVRQVMSPWAAQHRVPIVEVSARKWPTGDDRTLLSHLLAYNGCQACGVTADDECSPTCNSTRNTGGDLPIPVKLLPSRAPVRRSCTKHWKILPIRSWLLAHGAAADDPAVVLIGISTDEFHRASNKFRHPAERAEYPLLDLGLSRQDCIRIIADAGLPVPGKSACWFCPFHSERDWSRRRVEAPELYERAVDLEEHLNLQRKRRNLSPVRFLASKPLREVTDPQPTLFDGAFNEGGCDEGYCWT